MWLFYFVFIYFATFNLITGIPTSKFGPFYIQTRNVEKCTLDGPIDKENYFNSFFRTYKISRFKEESSGYIQIPVDIPNSKGLINVGIWRDGGFQPMLNIQLDKPCDHYFIGKIIHQFFTNIGEHCIFRKGNYTISNVDPTALAQSIIGKNFFYEKLSISFAWLTKKGLVFCSRIMCEAKPLPKGYYEARSNNKTIRG